MVSDLYWIFNTIKKLQTLFMCYKNNLLKNNIFTLTANLKKIISRYNRFLTKICHQIRAAKCEFHTFKQVVKSAYVEVCRLCLITNVLLCSWGFYGNMFSLDWRGKKMIWSLYTSAWKPKCPQKKKKISLWFLFFFHRNLNNEENYVVKALN